MPRLSCSDSVTCRCRRVLDCCSKWRHATGPGATGRWDTDATDVFQTTAFCCAGFAGFWAAIQGANTLQGLVPRERWDADALYSTEAEPGLSYARFGAFLQVMTS